MYLFLRSHYLQILDSNSKTLISLNSNNNPSSDIDPQKSIQEALSIKLAKEVETELNQIDFKSQIQCTNNKNPDIEAVCNKCQV